MLRIKLTTNHYNPKRKLYSPTALTNAYKAVVEDNLPVYRAARQFQVPLTTLRDRVDKRVSVDCTKPGPEPVLSQFEEARLVDHIKELASVGYGYTRAEILTMATDYAVYLGKKTKTDKCFSMQWFYNFMSRWPELHVTKPSSLSELRAKCASPESISNYFTELEHIMTKHNLKNRPHLIYNIDEKGINTECKPPNVVAAKGYHPQAIMADRSKTITIIGAGNALGSHIPPFFVFPGQRMVPDLMEGKSVGADGTMTPTGWSNSEVFSRYMKNHFMQYVQGRNSSDPILVLYDGHKSHIALDLVDWAKDNNIILFVLPPHCSHVLQPMDVGCFGPLQLKYSQECLTFTRCNHRTVTRYDVCGLACRAYSAALSESNLQSAFAKAGIYPLRTAEYMLESLKNKVAPSSVYKEPTAENLNDVNHVDIPVPVAHQAQISETISGASFFETRGGKVGITIEKQKKKRKNISSVVGGKAITEEPTLKKMKEYVDDQKRQPKAVNNCGSKNKNKSPKNACLHKSPQPGPSRISKPQLLDTDSSSSDEETESQMDQESKCCVCKRFFVKSANIHKVALVNWAQCDSCGHWVHLTFCTKIRVVRRDTVFKCPCC